MRYVAAALLYASYLFFKAGLPAAIAGYIFTLYIYHLKYVNTLIYLTRT
jgi:hypothetical protein